MTDIVTEVFNFYIYATNRGTLIVLLTNRNVNLSTNRGTLVVYIAQTVYVLDHCKYIAICSIDVIVDDFDRLDLFFLIFFILRLTVCQVVNSVFSHRHENSYLLFYSRFSISLYIVLVFKLITNLFGVKAWYFYYGKCSLAVWL